MTSSPRPAADDGHEKGHDDGHDGGHFNRTVASVASCILAIPGIKSFIFGLGGLGGAHDDDGHDEGHDDGNDDGHADGHDDGHDDGQSSIGVRHLPCKGSEAKKDCHMPRNNATLIPHNGLKSNEHKPTTQACFMPISPKLKPLEYLPSDNTDANANACPVGRSF